MKSLISFIAFLAAATPASAQDPVFLLPDGNLVKLSGVGCPQGALCVPTASQPVEGVVVNLMLPEWSKDKELDVLVNDLGANAYLMGLSDSTIIDNCNTCDCCIIYKKPQLAADFERWDASRFGGVVNTTGAMKQ